MDEEKVLRDMESGEEFTMTEFRAQYEQLKRDGETEAETFEDYVRNSTEKNGFCEWIDEIQYKCIAITTILLIIYLIDCFFSKYF